MGTKSSDQLKQLHEQAKKKRELRYHIVSFVMMLFLTLLAFAAVKYESFNPEFVPLFILTLAIVQVIFQLYYFMHLKDKGHVFPAAFIASGVFVAVLTIASLMTLVWYS